VLSEPNSRVSRDKSFADDLNKERLRERIHIGTSKLSNRNYQTVVLITE